MSPFPSSDGAVAASVRPIIRAAMLVLPLIAGCAEFGAPVTLERAALALPAGGARATVYLTVRNTSGRPVRIAGLSVDGATRTTLQTTTAHRMPAGSAAMGPTDLLSPVTSVAVEAGATVRLSPGGYAGLIDSLARPLARGDSVRVTVTLETGERAQVMARVVTYPELERWLAEADTGIAVAVSAPPTVAEGRTIYQSDGCASCHGLTGQGDGPVGRTLMPPPRDFRDARAFRNGADAESIAQTLATGIPGGGQMPLYAHLTLRERQSLALYLIALRTPSNETDR